MASDTGELRWSDAAGFTVWVCSDLTGQRLATDPAAIADLIRSLPDPPRRCTPPLYLADDSESSQRSLASDHRINFSTHF